ncbi:hypothetical protein WMY93_002407 [Mugilogobius chulae]|uniref:Uncharacterized protein n=1 Tax=Mugilogobius chulae TaxID=88201 RepID=A0AAW0Q8M6_9GOBI
MTEKIDNEAPTGDDVSDASAKANGSERGRDSTEASQLSLKDIIEQISCLNTELTASWVTFKEDLRREMRDDFAQFTMQMEQQLASTSLKLQEHDQKLDEAAARIDEQENWLAVANEALQQLLMEHKTLQEKLNDLESRSRRTNVRIYGVPEGALAPKPNSAAPPRSIVVNFLQYRVKETIIRNAWKKKIKIGDNTLSFDYDYT